MDKCYFKAHHKVLTLLFLSLFAASCKKDPQVNPISTSPVNFAKLGLYEEAASSTQSRRIFIACSKLGDITTQNYGLVFDTGSTGMTIDANGILPASMITSDGFQITGDSIVVSGITITSQKAVISYGGVDGAISEYGNLAYANVTIGDGHGNVTTPRIPFFLYYKVTNLTTGAQLAAHSADVFGVAPGVSATSRKIASPLSYFALASNITSGFRLAQLNSANFLTSATYTADLLYIGLTPADLNSSNFVMHPLAYNAISGYSPNIASSITYNGKTVQGTILFDTGTPLTTIVEDPSAASNSAALPANSSVSITTGQGFNYQYTTTSTFNLTEVQNPSYSKDNRTIFSIDFFLNNEYLLDYANNRIGLKNN
ncbi:hypothetical protein [Mucilaginibacter sp. dw_454]|uniref:hypothetical protein n=1 Tax=Mucilaginibacter sp. dw_454 TaxID=2720079 RepID=UPI001BD2B11F|nr:hypothetical protein [Mucilaginibacter sp. dw_454]